MDNTFDRMFYGKGEHLAGVDESGVSDIAGPLVAACVILKPISVDQDDLRIFEVNDCKKIPEKYRKKHAEVIWECALGIGIGEVQPGEIDYLGKRNATILAMMRAIGNCQNQTRRAIHPNFILVDGETPLPTTIEHQTIKDGDQKSLCVAAASIIAKVYRDDTMIALHERFPFYDWAKNKGYPCENHFKGIDKNGIVVGVHRTKFWPFFPNKERPDDEKYWYARRGQWRQRTTDALLKELGEDLWKKTTDKKS